MKVITNEIPEQTKLFSFSVQIGKEKFSFNIEAHSWHQAQGFLRDGLVIDGEIIEKIDAPELNEKYLSALSKQKGRSLTPDEI